MHDYAVVPTTLGERIKDARIDAGLSQAQLAEPIGVDQATISRWERDESEPSIRDAAALAAAVNVEPCQLFFPGQCETA